MKIKRFNESVDNKLTYHEAFNKYIKGKKIIDMYSVYPYGDTSLSHEERFYGEGVVVEGDYKILYYGGGDSGEDFNTSFIVSPNEVLISKIDF